MVFAFAIRGEGKCEVNYFYKNSFSNSGSFLTIFCRRIAGKDD